MKAPIDAEAVNLRKLWFVGGFRSPWLLSCGNVIVRSELLFVCGPTPMRGECAGARERARAAAARVPFVPRSERGGRSRFLEPNGRRAGRHYRSQVQRSRAYGCRGNHTPRGRPDGLRAAARTVHRAINFQACTAARSCPQATRGQPTPSRGRPASDAPAAAPRPHPRCKTSADAPRVRSVRRTTT